MIEEKKPTDETAAVKKDWQIAVKWLNTSGLRILIGIAIALTIALIILAATIKDPDTRANVVTVGVLTILTIVVTTIAAVSNRLMVEIMDRQETEMTEQRKAMQEGLAHTKTLLAQNERVIQHSEQQERSRRRREQAMIDAADRQANSAKAQSEMMRETIIQAREQFLLTNKPVIILTNHFLRIAGGTFTGPVEVGLEMMNTGNGIANNVNLRVRRAFLDKEQSDFVEKGGQPTGDIGEFINKGIVGNGGVVEHITSPIDNQGGATFYVWGEVTYSDAFSDPTTYITFFCLSAKDGDKKLAYCRHGNMIGELAKTDLSKMWNRLPIPDKTSGNEADDDPEKAN